MWQVRKSEDRGSADHGWLKSRHTFSFADYYDPRQMGFSVLRVINEDRVAPGKGFGTHSHADMEIISYVLQGKLAHRDSMGTGSVIAPGDIQRMSAGSGVSHSEMNPSSTEPVHFLQIWILPSMRGTPPSYAQKHFSDGEKRGRLRLVVAPGGAEGSVSLQQDARMYAGLFDADEIATYAVERARCGFVHIARGALKVNDDALEAGDALKVSGPASLQFHEGRGAEVLVFDLPRKE
jgi:quercetin 2,3-dioxygenase